MQSEGELFFDKTYDSSEHNSEKDLPLPFIGHYPPGTVYTHNFSWIISPAQNTQVLFFVQLFAENEKNQPHWNAYNWDTIGCKE